MAQGFLPISKEDLEDIDKWLLSKYNNLVINVTEQMEAYDLNKVTHLIQDFVCDDLSNWYIRSNRRRFWDSELTESKKQVYLTMYEALVTLCKLCAPITPFMTEEIYRKLTGEESVHLAEFPVENSDLINASMIKTIGKIMINKLFIKSVEICGITSKIKSISENIYSK